ncbi:KUP/HAK/KT family potassium transporter [Paraburkholderia xenovorans]|uniref:KUP/HAK/KT family potassium transporter n=1 Tax=Paraburkholderia xenovorans TaxID=36873 RepID=UPI0038BD0873
MAQGAPDSRRPHEKRQPPLAPLIHSLCDGAHSPPRVNGTAVFPGGVADMAPNAFLHNLKHNGVMHQVNIFLAGTTDNVPHVPDEKKAAVVDLGHGCYAVTVHHGFMEIPNVPRFLNSRRSRCLTALRA